MEKVAALEAKSRCASGGRPRREDGDAPGEERLHRGALERAERGAAEEGLRGVLGDDPLERVRRVPEDPEVQVFERVPEVHRERGRGVLRGGRDPEFVRQVAGDAELRDGGRGAGLERRGDEVAGQASALISASTPAVNSSSSSSARRRVRRSV
jgi:hypothetical protein